MESAGALNLGRASSKNGRMRASRELAGLISERGEACGDHGWKCCGSMRRALSAAALACRWRSPRRPRPGQRVDLKVLLISADGTRAGLRRLEGAARARGRALRHARGHNGRPRATLTDARLADYARQPRRYQAVILATRRPRARRHQPRRHDQLPVGVHRRRVGDAGEVRAHVRHPPAERLHRAERRRTGSTPAGGAQQDGVAGTAHRRRASRVPVPQGPGDDRRRRSRRAPRRSATGRRRSTRATGRRCSPARATPPSSASTRTRTTGARRWS